jgi:hypothetical protein
VAQSPPWPISAGPAAPFPPSPPPRPTALASLPLVGTRARGPARPAAPPRARQRRGPARLLPRPQPSRGLSCPVASARAQRVRAWSASAARPTALSRPAARTHPRVERRHTAQLRAHDRAYRAWAVPRPQPRGQPVPRAGSTASSQTKPHIFSRQSRSVSVRIPSFSRPRPRSPPCRRRRRCAALRPARSRRAVEVSSPRPLSPSPFSFSHRMRSLRPGSPSSRRSSSPARPRPAAAQLRGQQALL